MTVTSDSFRNDFPEFGDATVYADSAVNFWLTYAGRLLNASRWGNLIDLGTELFVAHNLALEAKAQAEANNGAIPGGASGPVASKSVEGVSVSYDTGSAAELNAGHWNLTIYGTRYVRMSRMMGAGPVQL